MGTVVLNGLTATINSWSNSSIILSAETVKFDQKPSKIRVPGGRYLQMKLDLVIKIPDVKVYGRAQDFTIFNGKVYDPERVVQLMAIPIVGDLIVRSFDAHYEEAVKDRVKKAGERYKQLWSQGFYKLESAGNFNFQPNHWVFDHVQTGAVDYEAYPAAQNPFTGLKDI